MPPAACTAEMFCGVREKRRIGGTRTLLAGRVLARRLPAQLLLLLGCSQTAAPHGPLPARLQQALDAGPGHAHVLVALPRLVALGALRLASRGRRAWGALQPGPPARRCCTAAPPTRTLRLCRPARPRPAPRRAATHRVGARVASKGQLILSGPKGGGVLHRQPKPLQLRRRLLVQPQAVQLPGPAGAEHLQHCGRGWRRWRQA